MHEITRSSLRLAYLKYYFNCPNKNNFILPNRRTEYFCFLKTFVIFLYFFNV